ncbi:MAG: tRNA lysidine(34) synthetase TilS [Clostridia bacterium]|nr:tRNA lysidine(34) synthetase TilS [Clostridia bacterium]
MLKEQVINVIKKYNLIENGDKIVVGVSGGPDSICLINLLYDIQNAKEIEFKIYVCHINHMIRIEAKDDEEFVKNYCEKKKIPFFSKHANIEELTKKLKIGTEEAGRKVRYEFFEEILKKEKANKIATAHTKNDNVETVLMNIIRGAGTAGLKGIEAKRENKYIKPLIEISRKEIEEYCKENKLNPRYDKTNDENIYTRNKVRNILIPLIEEKFNPNIVETIDRLSNLASKENEYLEKVTKETYERLLIKEEKKEIILNLKEFNKEDEVIKSRIILYTIKRLFGSTKGIEKIHIDDIIKLCKTNIGNKYLTPNKNIKIAINKGKMFYFVTQNSQTT